MINQLMLTSHSDSRASLKKPQEIECLEVASASLICAIQYEIEDSVLNLLHSMNTDAFDVGVSNFAKLSDLDLGLGPGFVGIECLSGGLADLCFADERP
jgi:hypothetical protein